MNRRLTQALFNFHLPPTERYGVYPLYPGKDLADRYSIAGMTVVLMIVYLNIADYANALNKGMAPKYFYAGFVLLLMPLLLRFKTWVKFLLSPFALWAFVVISFNMVYLLNGTVQENGLQVEIAGSRIKTMLLAMLLAMAFSRVRTARFEWVFPVLAVILVLLVVVDFSVPGFLYPLDTDGAVRGRSAATFINPTTAGEAMLVLFLLSCQPLRPALRMALLLLVGVGVFLTFSRSAIIAWLALWMVLGVTRVLPRSAMVLLLVVLAVVPLFLGGLQIYLDSKTEFAPAMVDLQQRLAFLSNGSLNDASAVERSMVLKAGWETFLNNMVVGAGPGSTESWRHPTGSVGAHNQFVMLAADYGLFGIAMWASLIFILWHGEYFREKALQHSMCLLFILMTAFTHNMFDFPFWLLTFALASGKRRV
jgi:O-antigen ligase